MAMRPTQAEIDSIASKLTARIEKTLEKKIAAANSEAANKLSLVGQQAQADANLKFAKALVKEAKLTPQTVFIRDLYWYKGRSPYGLFGHDSQGNRQDWMTVDALEYMMDDATNFTFEIYLDPSAVKAMCATLDANNVEYLEASGRIFARL